MLNCCASSRNHELVEGESEFTLIFTRREPGYGRVDPQDTGELKQDTGEQIQDT